MPYNKSHVYHLFYNYNYHFYNNYSLQHQQNDKANCYLCFSHSAPVHWVNNCALLSPQLQTIEFDTRLHVSGCNTGHVQRLEWCLFILPSNAQNCLGDIHCSHHTTEALGKSWIVLEKLCLCVTHVNKGRASITQSRNLYGI